jgi:hypothetical protein
MYLILAAALGLGFAQLPTEMSDNNRALPVRRADNLTALCDPIV